MFFLKRNLPTWERAARIIGGIAVGAAVTRVLTAFVGFCPACAMVGRRYLDK